MLTLHREGERGDRHHVLRVAKANYGPSELECRLEPLTVGSVGTGNGMPVAFKAGGDGWTGFGAKGAAAQEKGGRRPNGAAAEKPSAL